VVVNKSKNQPHKLKKTFTISEVMHGKILVTTLGRSSKVQ
jgi:membrane protein involved in colicin uptake